jgi:protein-L-isoaspartate O-methyltransferase
MEKKVILCAIAKNESAYLVEWISYHKFIVGFDEVLIYENDSTDDSNSLLQELQKLGLCQYITWNRKAGIPPQQTAYNHAIKTQKNIYQWICFLDLDEFLVLKKYNSIHDCISHFQHFADSISLNWRGFGSSFHDFYSPEPVMKRFTKCGEENLPFHKHMKSIVKIDSIQDINVHIHRLKPNCKYFHIDGIEINYGNNPNDEHIKGDGYINYEFGQINHYFLKSREECNSIELRGLACADENSPMYRIKPRNFSHYNEYNEIECFDTINIVNELEDQIKSIYKSIGGQELWTIKFKEFFHSESTRYNNLIKDYLPLTEQVSKKSVASVPLWAPESIGKVAEYLALHINSKVLEFGSDYSIGSTMWLSNYNVDLTSIQHDQSIFLALKSKLDELKISNVSLIFQEEINATITNQFPDHYFDLIVIQTGNINNCIQSSIKKVKDGGLILLNDAQRSRYRQGRNLLEAFPCVRYYHPHRYTQIWFIRHDLDYVNLDVPNPFD